MKNDYGVFEDVLAAASIGSWKIELDDGAPPRLYADATMRRLIGLGEDDAGLGPEQVYRAWHERIDSAHLDAVAEGVEYMLRGEMAEIQYPWHHPDGRTIIVRCGGVRDFTYGYGARIAGIHQWVTTMHHVDRELETQRRLLEEETNRFGVVKNAINAAQWAMKIDADGEVVAVKFDPDAARLLNVDVVEEPHAWEKVVHPDDLPGALAAFNAAVADKSAKTPYDVNYRMIDRTGNYRWYRSVGKVLRNGNGTADIVGIHIDITAKVEEQNRRMLGAIPLAPDILAKSNIGLWALELDEGKAPRMYVNRPTLSLIGLDRQIPPEDTYRAWHDRIDRDSRQIVSDAVMKMMGGEHAEVQYPWHHPDGTTMIIRCGGVRNPEYKRGVRIEGTYQNVSEVVHYDDAEVRRLRARETELMHAEFRASAIAYLSEHEYDESGFLDFFAGRLRELIKCDQVAYYGPGGESVVKNAPDLGKGFKLDPSMCRRCPHHINRLKADIGSARVQETHRSGPGGEDVPDECPVKSSLMRGIFLDGAVKGLLTIRYLESPHTFTDNERRTFEEFSNLLSISLSRMAARKKNAELERELELKRQIAAQRDRLERQQRELEAALKKAEEANRAKTEFLFNMSHDIRTPLDVIKGFGQIMLKNLGDAEKIRDCIQKSQKASELLQTLIDNVLDMSRIEVGQTKAEESPVEVDRSFAEIESTMSELAKSAGVSLSFEIGDIPNLSVFADPHRCSRVLVNLVSNAIKYSRRNGWVKARCEQVSKPENGRAWYRYVVSDNGIGMSEEFQAHIFEEFARERNSTTSGIQGTGLGLALCKSFVELMGGMIECSSKRGEGTTFTVMLPFRVRDGDRRDKGGDAAAGSGPVARETERSFSGKRVLLVEDNELNREVAEFMLKELGFAVDSAENGAEAVSLVMEAQRGCYDLVLMDIQMPVMDGYAATKAIRAQERSAEHLPIVALSANAFAEDRAASLAAGMDGHVAKPIALQELSAVLGKCLRKA